MAMRAVNTGGSSIKATGSSVPNIAGAVFIPDYDDASQDHYDPNYLHPDGSRGALIGVILGRFEFVTMPGAGLTTQAAEHPLRTDIAGARAKVENDKYCREALNKLLAAVEPGGFIDNQKFVDGLAVFVDIFDALDRLSATDVVRTGDENVRREGMVEYVNDLSVDVGGTRLYVHSTYATRSREEKTFGLLHESLHMFSGHTDQALAVAAQRASGVKDKDIKYFPNDRNGMEKASLKLNEYINRHCKGLSVGSGTTIRLGE